MTRRKWPRRATPAVACAIVCAAVAAAAPGAAAQSPRYTYTDVGYSGTYPQINNNGEVLVRRAGNLYTGPASQDVVVPGNNSYLAGGTINDSGVVAYVGSTNNVQGVYTRAGRGGSVPPGGPGPQPVGTSANYTLFVFGNATPAINNAGLVVFYARAKDLSSEGLYTGPDPVADALAVRRNGGPFSEVNHDFTSLNNNGVVAFMGVLSTGEQGIFTASRGAPFTTVATNAGPFSVFASPAINDAGRIAFYGETDNGIKGIFRGTDPATDLVARQGTGAPYLSVEDYPDIGNDGTVVFNATRLNSAYGVYTGPDPVADRVLSDTDTLFGSRVTSVQYVRGGINDLGQIAISYRLEDGRSGVVLASPVPEPAIPAAGALAVSGLLARRRQRSHGSFTMPS